MKIINKKRPILLSGLIVLIFILILFLNINVSYSQDDKKHLNISSSQYMDESLTVFQKFSMLEIAESNGTLINNSSININLGTPRWNVTNMEFNITGIDFENETKTVIDFEQLDPSHTLDKNFPMLGAQFKIDVPTILYGVEIYGYNSSQQPTDMYFHVFGTDSVGAPDETTTYGDPISLNMSSNVGIGWHRQLFSSPIDLLNGYYYFVMNGTSIGLSPPSQKSYRWYYKNYDPNNPNLNSSQYDKNLGWIEDYRFPGQPFTYKLIQRINKTFYPSEINMTAEIDGIDYSFNNGNEVGKGNLSVSLDNYFPDASTLVIPVKNNISDALFFNLSYYIKLNNTLSCGGSVLIKENHDNLWTIDPDLDRFGYNYSIKYEYPDNWKYVSVFKGVDNITEDPDVSINGNSVYILNDTITQNADLKIIANSTNLYVDLRVPLTNFDAGEKLEFFVEAPAKLGNYTFVLLNTIGSKEHEKLVVITDSAEFTLNHTLPSSAISGEWTAYVFWNNETDAGVQTQAFQITGIGGPGPRDNGDDDDDTEEAGGIDPLLIFAIVLIGGIISAGSFISYKSVKRFRSARDERRQKLTNKIRDIINLNYIMVIEKKSGLNVYEQYIAGKEIDATLISGFLEAIRAFGIELTKSFDQSQSISLEYKDSKVLMSEFKDFRIILILKERPSEELLRSISDLSYSIESKFGQEIKSFKGIKTHFTGIRELVEEHLHTSFVSPLKVVEKIDVKLTVGERAMIDKAKQIMKDFNLNYIHSTFLISEQKFKPRDIEIILDLIKKKIFQPITTTSF